MMRLRDGAVVSDAGRPVHFGAPLVEQRELAAGRGLVEMDLDVVRVGGPDRLSWLNLLLTAAVAELGVGQSVEALVLDPAGHVEYAAGVVDDGAAAWLLVDSGFGGGLRDYLVSMKFRADVTIECADDVAPVGFVGPVPAEFAGLVCWHDPWPGVAEGGTRYAVDGPDHPGSRWDFTVALLPAARADDVVDSALAGGYRICGLWAYEALRIEAWRPRLANEASAAGPVLPHEVDWLRTAVHLNKGCYRGQETVAKVFNVGRPPRRLVFVHLDGSDHELPPAGAEVFVRDGEGGAIGTLTGAGQHYELGPIGLALVRRRVPVDAELAVAGREGVVVSASQSVIVPEAGEAADRPVFAKPPVRRLPGAAR